MSKCWINTEDRKEALLLINGFWNKIFTQAGSAKTDWINIRLTGKSIQALSEGKKRRTQKENLRQIKLESKTEA